MTLTACTFAGNAAAASSGGAIYLQSGATLLGSGCTFDGNSALTGGGIGRVSGASTKARPLRFGLAVNGNG